MHRYRSTDDCARVFRPVQLDRTVPARATIRRGRINLSELTRLVSCHAYQPDIERVARVPLELEGNGWLREGHASRRLGEGCLSSPFMWATYLHSSAFDVGGDRARVEAETGADVHEGQS